MSAGTSSEVSDCVGGGTFRGHSGPYLRVHSAPSRYVREPSQRRRPRDSALDPFAAEGSAAGERGRGFGSATCQ